MSVLILSASGDWSAGVVAGELDASGVPYAWIDPGDFPLRMTLATQLGVRRGHRWTGTLRADAEQVELGDVSAVYYRRPTDFAVSREMSEPEQQFARAQARAGVGGVLSALPVRWINHPAAMADVDDYKPRQLAMAMDLGLAVPETLITNEHEAVRRFADEVGPVVVKPLATPIVEEAGGSTVAWTRRVETAEMVELAGVEQTAHLFQREITPKAFEVRMTVVGPHRFVVAIHAGSPAARIDWRTDYDALRYEVIDCPPALAAATDAMLVRFGLTYGSFDFAVDTEKTWWFLELNAGGQWGWLAEACRLPIAGAIAEELTKEGAS